MKKKKETIKFPTIEQLKEFLNHIKWDLRHVGCDYYRIVNHRGKDTVFEILKGSDELKNGMNHNVFGDPYCGAIVIKLSAIKLSYISGISGSPFVSITLNRVNSNNFFISFYNHD